MAENAIAVWAKYVLIPHELTMPTIISPRQASSNDGVYGSTPYPFTLSHGKVEAQNIM